MTREQLFLKRGARPKKSKQNMGHGNGAVASEEWGVAKKFQTEPGPLQRSSSF